MNVRSCCTHLLVSLAVILLIMPAVAQQTKTSRRAIKEINAGEIKVNDKIIAIVNAVVIDGNGGPPLVNGVVIVKGNKIEAVGVSGKIVIPQNATITDAKGMSLLPGLIDSHFHLDNMHGLPALFLQHGVTSVRDPGAWIETYDAERVDDKMIPRLFLTGPHLDMYPPAYPHDAVVVRDSLEAVQQVDKLVANGATAVKIYFRIPVNMIGQICRRVHQYGLPVTAHLEIAEAVQAIEAGLDGIEHITSFGQSLVTQREAEKYRQSVLLDNNERKQGRYDLWKTIDVNSAKTDSLCRYVAKKKIFISPTLGAFEYQPSANEADTIKLVAFNNMKAFTAKLKKAGARIVLGSHSSIPYAEHGWAFQHEMELFAESGISNADIIVAATMQNARYFHIDDKLGSIEKGKLADLILIKGNPLADISAMKNVEQVMLNGVWVEK